MDGVTKLVVDVRKKRERKKRWHREDSDVGVIEKLKNNRSAENSNAKTGRRVIEKSFAAKNSIVVVGSYDFNGLLEP